MTHFLEVNHLNSIAFPFKVMHLLRIDSRRRAITTDSMISIVAKEPATHVGLYYHLNSQIQIDLLNITLSLG